MYTYSEARQNFAFRLVASDDSPLSVEGIDLGLTAEEILEFMQEGRRL